MSHAGYFGLLDCNNFYASCERVFNPKLKGVPVVILSNNDGCVIARSQEAKDVGIEMGTPAFQMQEAFDKHNVRVLSSNYTLYGDMSARVVNVIRDQVPALEIYSIDECFIWWPSVPPEDYLAALHQRVLKATGIPICIGVARTKTLAKLSNRIAKSTFGKQPVHILQDAQMDQSDIGKMDVSKIWGIGSRNSLKLHIQGIRTIADFVNADAKKVRSLLGVTGERTLLELRGVSCLGLETVPPFPKSICSSRSFGRPVEEFEELSEALCSYIAVAAEKLRSKSAICGSMTVFLETYRHRTEWKQRFPSKTCQFDPSCDTSQLIAIGERMLEVIYKSGFKYAKCGVSLDDIQSQACYQLPLFTDDRAARINSIVDQLNQSLGRETIKYGSTGVERKWGMKRNRLSRRFTTHWDELLTAKV